LGGGVLFCYGQIKNCIFYLNYIPSWSDPWETCSQPFYCYLDDGGYGSPEFVSTFDTGIDILDFDFHLLPSSPCIDAGDPNQPEDPNDHDIDGESRIMCGRIDIGADEYAFGELSDFSGNGIVNFEDFATLAYYWKDYICTEPDWCDGCDLDHSGLVDLNDLRKFAENWLWQASWFSD